MLPELAQMILLAGTGLAGMNLVTGLMSIRRGQPQLVVYQRSLSLATCLSLIACLVLLAISFLQNDFSVTYIAQHSNTQLPTIYKVAAVWAGHEGSFFHSFPCCCHIAKA